MPAVTCQEKDFFQSIYVPQAAILAGNLLSLHCVKLHLEN